MKWPKIKLKKKKGSLIGHETKNICNACNQSILALASHTEKEYVSWKTQELANTPTIYALIDRGEVCFSCLQYIKGKNHVL